MTNLDFDEDEISGTTGDAAEVPEEIKAQARLTVCRMATSAADAALLMNILGITPDKKPDPKMPHCQKCDSPMARSAIAGYKKTGADGLCRGCTNRARKAEIKPPRNYVRSAPGVATANPGRCKRCNVPTARKNNMKAGDARYGGRGMCERCYQFVRRSEIGENTPRVPADESQDRLREMRAAGMTNPEIIAATGLSKATVNSLLYGLRGKHREKVRKSTHDQIMATPIRRAAS